MQSRKRIVLIGLKIIILMLILGCHSEIVPRESNEEHAARALRSYLTHQEMYRRRNGFTAVSLDDLRSAGLEDDIINSSNTVENIRPYRGYLLISITKGHNGPLNSKKGEFALCAVPARYGGRNSMKTFITNQDSKIYWKDTGGKPLITFPNESELEKWNISEF